MTWTIKLSEDGGISFDSDGMLEMIGEPNQISLDEVRQRTEIRFQTQSRSNLLHPMDGFDYQLLTQIQRNTASYTISPDVLLEQELRATLMQDKDIQQEDAEISISVEAGRRYAARVIYQLRGTFKDRIELTGSLGAF